LSAALHFRVIIIKRPQLKLSTPPPSSQHQQLLLSDLFNGLSTPSIVCAVQFSFKYNNQAILFEQFRKNGEHSQQALSPRGSEVP
jgi:hypothetical protein